MSDPVVQEPSSHGSVLIKTSSGDMTVELWSRECPKACRNFVQLCLEGYYNGCIFHRIIPGFMVQTGDPSNAGTTCESVFGAPFPDEINPRLRFRYRGMLGVANAGKGTDTNGSQFFITLAKQDTLNGRHTLFGKLIASSVYTLTDIAETEVDRNDRPMGEFPPTILETIVLVNPFPDIVPRTTKAPFKPHDPRSLAQKTTLPKKAPLKARRSGVLSFGNDEDEIVRPTNSMRCTDVVPEERSMGEARVHQMTRASEPGPPRPAEAAPEKAALSDKQAMVLAEIEKVKRAIAEASQGNKVAVPAVVPISEKRKLQNREEIVLKKLKSWKDTVGRMNATGTRSMEPVASSGSARNEKSTLHEILSSAEKEDLDVSSSGWLRNAGTVKFAIDSRRAYQLGDEKRED